MENRSNKSLAIILLILSIASYSFPSYYDSFWMLFYWIGIALNILVGILFLIGTIKSKRRITRGGFGFGLIAWILLVIISIHGISWSQIQVIKENYLLILISSIWELYILMPWTGKIREISHYYSRMSFYGSIIHIILSLGGFLIGTIIFIRESKHPTLSLGLGDQDKLTQPQVEFSETIDRTQLIPQIHEKSRNNNVETSLDLIICPICSQKNPNTSRICKNCFNEFLTCLICKRSISSEDQAFCPFCGASYHRIEFLEWLKVKAYCINCKKRLDMWEYQKFLKKSDTIGDNFSI